MSRFAVACLALILSFTAGAQSALDEALLVASPTMIEADPALLLRVRTLAEPALAEHCSGCHGANLEGDIGIPNLVDHEWIWGITGLEMSSAEPVFQIMQTMLYGVRNTACADEVKRYGACPDTRYSEMPAYADLGFTDQQIDDLVEYVFNLAGEEADAVAVARVQDLTGLCTECHGEGGYGYKAYGGPDLTDSIWLYGNSREQVRDVLAHGRKGTCPAWVGTLDAVTVKAIASYLYLRSAGSL